MALNARATQLVRRSIASQASPLQATALRLTRSSVQAQYGILRSRQSAWSGQSALSLTQISPFHASAPNAVQAGDSLPSVELMEDSPGNKVDLARLLGQNSGKAVIIGVPAAFSPACTATHIPGYIQHPRLADAGQVFVVSVNDAFVMKAWKDSLDPSGKSKIRFLADPAAAFAKALDVTFDGTAIFGGPRSKRYAVRIENGKVQSVHVEPDNIGVQESTADKVLQA